MSEVTCAVNGKYKTHPWKDSLDFYDTPEGDWNECRCCGLTPDVWEFDNGRSTFCGCFNSQYDHFAITAESINAVFSRTGLAGEYDIDALRKNWNIWCKTGSIEVIYE